MEIARVEWINPGNWGFELPTSKVLSQRRDRLADGFQMAITKSQSRFDRCFLSANLVINGASVLAL